MASFQIDDLQSTRSIIPEGEIQRELEFKELVAILFWIVIEYLESKYGQKESGCNWNPVWVVILADHF